MESKQEIESEEVVVMNEPYTDMDKDLGNNDFSIIRQSFRKFPEERLYYNLTFLCWIYFTHLLRKEYFDVKALGELRFDENDVKTFLFFDELPNTEYQKIVAAERVLKFRFLIARWIRFLFIDLADVADIVVIPGKGFGFLAKTNNNEIIFNHVTGHILEVPTNLEKFLRKNKYSSIIQTNPGNCHILFGFLSFVNHECKCPYTFSPCHNGLIKLCLKVPINSIGEVFDSRTDRVIDESAIPKIRYGIGNQVVVDYGNAGYFQCACFFCNRVPI